MNYWAGKPNEAEVYIKGKVASVSCFAFNIGTYFVPARTGHNVEQAMGIKVVVKIRGSEDGIIKQILLGGTPFNRTALIR